MRQRRYPLTHWEKLKAGAHRGLKESQLHRWWGGYTKVYMREWFLSKSRRSMSFYLLQTLVHSCQKMACLTECHRPLTKFECRTRWALFLDLKSWPSSDYPEQPWAFGLVIYQAAFSIDQPTPRPPEGTKSLTHQPQPFLTANQCMHKVARRRK